MIFILAGIVLFLATRTLASDPTTQSQFVAISNTGYFYQDAIYAYQLSTESNRLGTISEYSSGIPHSILASRSVTKNSLDKYFQELERSRGIKSPLAEYTQEISESPYSNTIIAIANAEESLIKTPYNNMGGLMLHGQLIHFANLSDWITAENNWLSDHEASHSTIESLNGYYVQPASSNWLNTVITTKQTIEALQ